LLAFSIRRKFCWPT